jgi:hypothetical protein
MGVFEGEAVAVVYQLHPAVEAFDRLDEVMQQFEADLFPIGSIKYEHFQIVLIPTKVNRVVLAAFVFPDEYLATLSNRLNAVGLRIQTSMPKIGEKYIDVNSHIKKAMNVEVASVYVFDVKPTVTATPLPEAAERPPIMIDFALYPREYQPKHYIVPRR